MSKLSAYFDYFKIIREHLQRDKHVTRQQLFYAGYDACKKELREFIRGGFEKEDITRWLKQ